MEIALLTLHWGNNYGGTLQTYATTKVLQKYGNVTVIDYRNRYAEKGMTLLRLGTRPRDVLRVGKDLLRLLPRARVIRKFAHFTRENLNLSETVRNFGDFACLRDRFDVCVSGSDQIWNPRITSEDGARLDERYFLDFVSKGAKVSYASSIGTFSYNKEHLKTVTRLLGGFTDVSVRERDTAQFLSELLARPVEHVVDPTLLLSKKDWFSHLGIDENRPQEPYILVYALKKDDLLRKVVEHVSGHLAVRVIAIDQDPFINYRCDAHIRDAGPTEFIGLIARASYVITNSFHGSCFAVNFGIPFVATTPPTGINRIASFLESVGLSDRLVSDISCLPQLMADPAREASAKLQVLRTESEEYLRKALGVFSGK